MAESVSVPSNSELGGLGSTFAVAHGDNVATMPSTFGSYDSDESLPSAEAGAAGVINPDLSGPSGGEGAPGPAAEK